MRLHTIAWLGLAGLVYAGPALALTITNLDSKAQTVSVTAGDKTEKLTVEPNKETEAACEGGCTVKLDSGDAYQMKGEEAVSIDGGAIFVNSSPDAFVEDLPSIDPDTVPDQPEDEEDTGDEEDMDEGEQAE